MINYKLSASNIIDSLMPYVDDIEVCHQTIPKGSFIYQDTPEERLCNKKRESERAFSFANDLLGISTAALYATVLTARRWYIRTRWERCLPYADADRLLLNMIEQYPMPKSHEI